MLRKAFFLILFLFLTSLNRSDLAYAAIPLSQDWHNDDNSLLGDFSYGFSLAINQPVYRFSIDANIGLNSEMSLLRVIVIDNQKREYLAYEAYPLIVSSNHFFIKEVCEETCVMAGIIPESLRVEGFKASFSLNKITFSSEVSELGIKGGMQGIASEITRLKVVQEDSKIQKIKTGIQTKNQKWLAGKTSVSGLTYQEKKKLFRSLKGVVPEKLPNLQGFEFYRGGVFEIKPKGLPQGGGPTGEPSITPYPTSTPIPFIPITRPSWDYRYAHNEDWNTSIKDQDGCGSCWAFAATGAMESFVNLYFNQHLNLDLSEQNGLSCGNSGTCEGGWPDDLLEYYRDVGAISESCFPYSARDLSCDQRCSNWQNETVKIGGTNYFFSPWQQQAYFDNFVKEKLIKNGVLSAVVSSWSHAMALVGFRVDPSGLVWIFKNSWGIDFGEKGYLYLQLPENDLSISVLEPPVVIAGEETDFNCLDKDGDGYCNWGISETKPATCPVSCRAEKDCDDSNLNLGPFDQDLNCQAITSCTTLIGPTNLRISQSSTIGYNNVDLEWDHSPNATFYSVKIDGTEGHWTGNCSSYDEICKDVYQGTKTTIQCVAGRRYRWWVQARNSCGEWGVETMGQEFTCAYSNPTPTPGVIRNVQVNFTSPKPWGALQLNIWDKPVEISALAYDVNNNPIWQGVTYEWGISSKSSIGKLSPTEGNITSFIPYKAGYGDIYVIARIDSEQVTKGISVSVDPYWPDLYQKRGWSRINWRGFYEELLPKSCPIYSRIQNGWWVGNQLNYLGWLPTVFDSVIVYPRCR